MGGGGLEADLSGSEAATSRHSRCIRQFPRPDALAESKKRLHSSLWQQTLLNLDT